MSRDIDWSKPLNAEDEAYVRQRSWLIRNAQLEGNTVQFESDSGETQEQVPNPADHDASDQPSVGLNEIPEEDDEDGDYNDWTVAQLKDEIAARNESREEDDQISADGKKADLVAALEADDEAEEA